MKYLVLEERKICVVLPKKHVYKFAMFVFAKFFILFYLTYFSEILVVIVHNTN
jgi:hypothetical protein